MNDKDLKLLRRGTPTAPMRTLRAGTIEINLQRSSLTVNGKPIKLTTKEFELLRELMETRGEVLSREFLLEKIWGYGKASEVDSRTIDVSISSRSSSNSLVVSLMGLPLTVREERWRLISIVPARSVRIGAVGVPRRNNFRSLSFMQRRYSMRPPLDARSRKAASCVHMRPSHR